jgi:hypothetical protein
MARQNAIPLVYNICFPPPQHLPSPFALTLSWQPRSLSLSSRSRHFPILDSSVGAFARIPFLLAPAGRQPVARPLCIRIDDPTSTPSLVRRPRAALATPDRHWALSTSPSPRPGGTRPRPLHSTSIRTPVHHLRTSRLAPSVLGPFPPLIRSPAHVTTSSGQSPQRSQLGKHSCASSCSSLRVASLAPRIFTPLLIIRHSVLLAQTQPPESPLTPEAL